MGCDGMVCMVDGDGDCDCGFRSYHDVLSGVVLCYSDVMLEGTTGVVQYTRPHINFVVEAKLVVFAPAVGGLLRACLVDFCFVCRSFDLSVCMYVWMYVCLSCMYLCMYVCMYVCMHVCMSVCMYGCMSTVSICCIGFVDNSFLPSSFPSSLP